MFKNVLYVLSLVENLLFVYQMTHIGSPKQVVFEPDSIEILDIYTRKMIAKGVANHASKAYEFSHFLPYSHQSALLTHANEMSRLKYLKYLHVTNIYNK